MGDALGVVLPQDVHVRHWLVADSGGARIVAVGGLVGQPPRAVQSLLAMDVGDCAAYDDGAVWARLKNQ